MEENIKDFITEKIPIYSVFLLVLIISGSFIVELFPCRLQRLFTENIYLKHLCAYFTLVFFLVITSPIKSKKYIFVKSIFVYIFFVLITKVHQNFFLIILFLLAISYTLALQKKDIELNHKENINEEEITKNNKIVDNVIFVIYIIVFILTIIGILIYIGEKKIEFKEKFSYSYFLFGIPKCSNKPIKVSMKKSLKHAFK
jgi:uncharacterized membrane protein